MYFDDDLVGDEPSCLHMPVAYADHWPELTRGEGHEETYRGIFQRSNDQLDKIIAPGEWGSKEFSVDLIRRRKSGLDRTTPFGMYSSGRIDNDSYVFNQRFEEVDAAWKQYIIDFDNLAGYAAKQKHNQTEGIDPTKHTLEEDDDTWNNFRNKWKIPPNLRFSDLALKTSFPRKSIETHQEPRFQRITLLDLPTEILDLSFRHASVGQARLLSATCRKLHNIGRTFGLCSRSLVLDLPTDKWLPWLKPSENHKETMSQLAFAERERLVTSSNFLISRPDLLDKINVLAISDRWKDVLLMKDIPHKDLFLDLEEGRFHAPIYKNILRVLKSSRNLTTLLIDHNEFSLTMIKHICALPQLHTLDVYACTIADKAEIALDDDVRRVLTSTSIQNLHITSPTDKLQNIWNTALMCPKLHTLSVRADNRTLFVPPHENTHSRFDFFQTLQSLYLGQIHHVAVPFVVDWFNGVVQYASPSNLTRLKIHNFFGLSDEHILQIMQPLKGAPLRVLSVDGLKQARLGVFDAIHRLFPDLISLSLCRRGGRHVGRLSLRWPSPDWHYAERLSIFTQLKYFRWNGSFDLVTESPSDIIYLEEGFPNKDSAAEAKETDFDAIMQRWEDEFITDGPWVPLLFAIHCPSLQVISCHIKTYYVSRSNAGKISVRKKPDLETNGYNYKLWDPPESDLYGRWPPIVQNVGTSRNTK
ncbi:hypothetical protein H0H87_012572 [Tephrocybe sp. NHM501043]|nr:hypothetical protein H0H87_012572 [Tephrocybe sp. NHM501043]